MVKCAGGQFVPEPGGGGGGGVGVGCAVGEGGGGASVGAGASAFGNEIWAGRGGASTDFGAAAGFSSAHPPPTIRAPTHARRHARPQRRCISPDIREPPAQRGARLHALVACKARIMINSRTMLIKSTALCSTRHR
jgi:hypothetical protein